MHWIVTIIINAQLNKGSKINMEKIRSPTRISRPGDSGDPRYPLH